MATLVKPFNLKVCAKIVDPQFAIVVYCCKEFFEIKKMHSFKSQLSERFQNGLLKSEEINFKGGFMFSKTLYNFFLREWICSTYLNRNWITCSDFSNNRTCMLIEFSKKILPIRSYSRVILQHYFDDQKVR